MIDDHRRLTASSKDEGPSLPRDREIRRNGGRLLGRLDELLPCIYLAGVVSDGECAPPAPPKKKPRYSGSPK